MKSFSVKNIKSFGDECRVELKPITILVGKNSCGKSSLLRFPAVLNQTFNYAGSEPPISFIGNQVDYGNFEDFVFGKSGREISFSLTYKVDIAGAISIKEMYGSSKFYVQRKRNIKEDFRDVTIKVSIVRVSKKIKVQSVELCVEEKTISKLEWRNDAQNYLLKLYAKYVSGKILDAYSEIIFPKESVEYEKFFPVYSDITNVIAKSINIQLEESSEEKIIKATFFKDTNNEVDFLTEDEKKVMEQQEVFDFSARVMTILYNLCVLEGKNRISYIGPFRKNPERIYRNSETTYRRVGSKGENVGEILVAARRRNDKDKLFDEISQQLKGLFRYDIELDELNDNYFSLMLKDENGVMANIIDVGFGISQSLPIVSEVCLLASRNDNRRSIDVGINDILLIEQPELHLHPAAQAEMADLFAMCVTQNKDARLIIETHSEHLISKLQVLIADEEYPLTNDMVQILYVDKNEEGCAFIDELGIKENGKFVKEWPTDFFDQGYKLSRALMHKSAARGKKND